MEVVSVAVRVEEDVFDEAVCMRMGWCPACGEFTTDVPSTRSKARVCAACGDDRVSGARHARSAGFIEVAL
jgi:hypothetical protein